MIKERSSFLFRSHETQETRGGSMQFILIVVTMLLGVAAGLIWSPLHMAIPLLFWLIVQILLYHANRDGE